VDHCSVHRLSKANDKRAKHFRCNWEISRDDYAPRARMPLSVTRSVLVRFVLNVLASVRRTTIDPQGPKWSLNCTFT
jgi:hypothetical protein